MRLALFDLDGTVLRGNSWQSFYWWTLRQSPARAPGLLSRLLLRRARLIDARTLQLAALQTLRGLDATAVAGFGRRMFDERLRAMIRPAARCEIARRIDEGCTVVLATAAFDFLAAPIAEDLGIKHVVATQIEFSNDTCIGTMRLPEPRGPAKAAAVRAKFTGADVDWLASCAYSDELEDLPLLSLVGTPVCIGVQRPAGLPSNVRVENWDSI
jgi:putative phosphoserine phosphatase/1-acylglycerol-3-phosphate O-acyltransferase